VKQVDYLGWELERQRAALAALLLGGGEGETSSREEERRSPAGPDAARKRAVRDAGRYVGGPRDAWRLEDRSFPERRTAAGSAGMREDGTAETPVSAWEALAGPEDSPLTARRGRSVKTDASAPSETAWGRLSRGADDIRALSEAASHVRQNGEKRAQTFSKEAARVRLSGGTGARPDLPGSLRGDRAQRDALEVSGTAEETAGPAETALYGAGPDSGGRPATKSGKRTAVIRRSGGGRAGTLDRNGLPFFQETEETGGAGPWGGGRGTAVLQTEDGARALSRAVQRDARRYDGGFYIY